MKKKTNIEFLAQLREKLSSTDELHNYNLDKVNYVDAKTKVIITCNKHGDKEILPNHLLHGRRCPDCKGGRLSKSLRSNYKDVLSKALLLNPGFDYSKFKYVNNKTPGIITCSNGHTFSMDMDHHLNRKQGCPECSKKIRRLHVEPLLADSFMKKAVSLFNDRYSYEKVDYKTCKDHVIVICKYHGEFLVTPDNHINAMSGCPKCSNSISLAETKLKEFVEGLGYTTICNTPMLGRKHIDIFIPELNIGIEYCGIYFHSEKCNKSWSYHRDKFILAKEKNIQLIQIFEDEWLENSDKVKSILKTKLHKLEKTISARNTKFIQISNAVAKNLYESEHIQGGVSSLGKSFGLELQGKVVAAMTFSTSSIPASDSGKSIELIRFSSVGRIPGAFSKLLKNAIPYIKSLGIKNIVSYSDNRWSNGKVYEVNGFINVGISKPRYWWVKNGKRFHRRRFQKKYLKERMGDNYDDTKSEAQNLYGLGFYRIWDAGVTRWELDISN